MSASKRTLSGRTRVTHSVGSDPGGEASSKRQFEVANCLRLNVCAEAFACPGRIHDTIPTGEWHLRRAQVDLFDVGNSGSMVRIAGTPIILAESANTPVLYAILDDAYICRRKPRRRIS
jgi:hypothetical protein